MSTAVSDERPNLVQLKICAHGDSLLKIVWADGTLNADPYFAYKTQFEDQAKLCRDLLAQLVDRFVNADQPAYGDLVRQLAEEGKVMHGLLFEQCCPEGFATAERVRRYLSRLGGPTQITINTDASCNIPWALLYDDADPYIGTAPRPSADDFPGFWGTKYSIASLIDGMGLVNLKPPRRRERFSTLLVFDSKEFARVRQHLTADELTFLEQLWTHRAGDANSWDDARDLWEEITAHDSLFYAYCHGTGSSLRLVDTQTDQANEINVAKFRRYFSKKPSHDPDASESATVCFLNGCSTATGAKDSHFKCATGGPGFYGFIGTETYVSNIFALKFSIAFFYYLLEKGWAVQKIFDLLRRRHWPLSLIYSNLAHPLFKVEPLAGSKSAPFDEDLNFSSLSLRTQGGPLA